MTHRGMIRNSSKLKRKKKTSPATRKKKKTQGKPVTQREANLSPLIARVSCQACKYLGTMTAVPDNAQGWKFQCRRCNAFYK